MQQVTEFLKTTYGKVAAAAVALVFFTILVASCSKPSPQIAYAGVPAVVQPQVVAPAAPTIVQAAPANNSGVGDFVTGAAVGAIAGHLLSNRSQPVQQGYTTTAPAQRYVVPSQAQRYIPPAAQRPQSVTNQRGITTTTQSRPSTFGSTTRQSVSVGRTTSTPSRR